MFELMDAYSQSAVIKVIGVGGGGSNARKPSAEPRRARLRKSANCVAYTRAVSPLAPGV